MEGRSTDRAARYRQPSWKPCPIATEAWLAVTRAFRSRASSVGDCSKACVAAAPGLPPSSKAALQAAMFDVDPTQPTL